MMTKRICLGLFAAGVLLCGVTTADARLSANRLSANRLSAYSAKANSAAASKLAASKLAIEQLGPHEYTVDPEAAGDLLATQDRREVLSFIVSCALPDGVTLLSTAPDGTLLEFFGELGLASEWVFTHGNAHHTK